MSPLKIATSADGFMADARQNHRWLTGDAARRHVHALRSRMDAVLTGIGTVLADDPELTCRLRGAENPYLVRIVRRPHTSCALGK
ncbi:MAG: dihydrofolate reductase family protein [Alphaproteobacteria bacterium]